MKILVLGNGFDLDHNLPTSYKQFLNFCGHVVYGISLGTDFYKELTDTQKEYVKKLEKKKGLKNRFVSLLKENHFLWYFLLQIESLGEDWIDLEKEITSIIHEFKEIEEEFLLSKQYRYTAFSEHKIHELIERLELKDIDCSRISEKSLNYIHKALYQSLDNFSKALEIYVVEFINTTRIRGVSPDITEFGATNILTFNYSETYERVYGGVQRVETINHIHGVAQSTLGEQADIILGITSNENLQNNRYVDFEKYFQRVTKKTGSKYKEWLCVKPVKGKSIEVAFFGHSLDSSDSDVIEDLVCNEATVVTIFYYDEKAHQNIVANLIDIIGKQKLINYSSGANPKITFIRQKKHQHNNTAGVEVQRDIRKLHKLYSLKKNEINRLLEKIDKRISSRNISYFYA